MNGWVWRGSEGRGLQRLSLLERDRDVLARRIQSPPSSCCPAHFWLPGWLGFAILIQGAITDTNWGEAEAICPMILMMIKKTMMMAKSSLYLKVSSLTLELRGWVGERILVFIWQPACQKEERREDQDPKVGLNQGLGPAPNILWPPINALCSLRGAPHWGDPKHLLWYLERSGVPLLYVLLKHCCPKSGQPLPSDGWVPQPKYTWRRAIIQGCQQHPCLIKYKPGVTMYK